MKKLLLLTLCFLGALSFLQGSVPDFSPVWLACVSEDQFTDCSVIRCEVDCNTSCNPSWQLDCATACGGNAY